MTSDPGLTAGPDPADLSGPELPELELSGTTELPAGARVWLVPTPVGNLGDITLRAVEVLRGADAVACEDTRRTGALLSHLGIGRRACSKSTPGSPTSPTRAPPA